MIKALFQVTKTDDYGQSYYNHHYNFVVEDINSDIIFKQAREFYESLKKNIDLLPISTCLTPEYSLKLLTWDETK